MRIQQLLATLLVAAAVVPVAYTAYANESQTAGSKPDGSAATTGKAAGQYIDDAALTTKVKIALLNDSVISAFEVKVDTERGIVTLSGTVDKTETIERAVRLAANVQGVRGVEVQMHTKVLPS